MYLIVFIFIYSILFLMLSSWKFSYDLFFMYIRMFICFQICFICLYWFYCLFIYAYIFFVIVIYIDKGSILYCIWIDPLLCFVCLLLRLYYKINIEFIFFFYFLELIIKEIVFNDCVFDFIYCWIFDQYYCLASLPFIIWWIRYSIAYIWYFVMPVQ